MVNDSHSADGRRSFVERVEVAGEQLVSTVKSLLEDTSAKRVIVKSSGGRTLISVPLSFGLAGSALAVILAPTFAAVAAIGAAFAKVSLEIEHEG